MVKKSKRHNQGNQKKTKNKKNAEESPDDSSIQPEGTKKCNHVNKATKLGVLQNHIPHAKLGECSYCTDPQDKSGICVCLRCGKQGCDRYSEDKHGLSHYQDSPSHCITVHLQSMMVWCYSCDMDIPVVPNTDLYECIKLLIKALKLNGPSDQQQFLPNILHVDQKLEKSLGHLTSNTNGKIKGLANLGNTCFFNAVMQNLAQTELLHVAMAFVNQKEYSQIVTTQNELPGMSVKVITTPGSLIVSLTKLLQEYRSSSPGPLSPKFLFSEICKKAPRFKGFRQQDSQELLRYLLDSVKTEQLRRVKIGLLQAFEINEGVDIKGLPEDKKQQITEYVHHVTAPAVDSVFAGKLDSIVVCHTCHKKSKVTESFLDLSLSLVGPQFVQGKSKNTKNPGTQFLVQKNKTMTHVDSQIEKGDSHSESKLQTPSKHQQKMAREAKRKKGKRGKGKQRSISHSASEDDKIETGQSRDIDSDPEVKDENVSVGETAEITENCSVVLVSPKDSGEQGMKDSLDDDDDSDDDCDADAGDGDAGIADAADGDADAADGDADAADGDAGVGDGDADAADGDAGVGYGDADAADGDTDAADGDAGVGDGGVGGCVGDADDKHGTLENLEEPADDAGMTEKSTCVNNEDNANNKHSSNKNVMIEDNSSNDHMDNEHLINEHTKNEFNDASDKKLFNNGEDSEIPAESGKKNILIENFKLEDSSREKEGTLTKTNDVVDNPCCDTFTLQHRETVSNGTLCPISKQCCEQIDASQDDTSPLKSKDHENCESSDSRNPNCTAKLPNSNVVNSVVKGLENIEIVDVSEDIPSNELTLGTIDDEKSEGEPNGANTPTSCNIEVNCANANDVSLEDDDNSTSFPKVLTIGPPYTLSPGECSVLSCLSMFCSPEILEGKNKFACEQCSNRQHTGCDDQEDDDGAESSDEEDSACSKGATALKPNTNKARQAKENQVVYTEATKQLLLSCTPPVLTLHFKRFQQVGFGLRKVPKHVDFPFVLDLAPFCSRGGEICPDSKQQVLYSLIGAVEHSGGLNSGHYTACVKLQNRPTYGHINDFSNIQDFSSFIAGLWKRDQGKECVHAEPRGGQWYHVSDSRVTMVTEAKVLKSQAYMLFYQRLPLEC